MASSSIMSSLTTTAAVEAGAGASIVTERGEVKRQLRLVPDSSSPSACSGVRLPETPGEVRPRAITLS